MSPDYEHLSEALHSTELVEYYCTIKIGDGKKEYNLLLDTNSKVCANIVAMGTI